MGENIRSSTKTTLLLPARQSGRKSSGNFPIKTFPTWLKPCAQGSRISRIMCGWLTRASLLMWTRMQNRTSRGFSAREISNINGETYTPDDSKRSKVKDDLVSFYSYTNYYARSKGMYAFCGVPVWKEGDASDAPLHFGEIPEAEWE